MEYRQKNAAGFEFPAEANAIGGGTGSSGEAGAAVAPSSCRQDFSMSYYM
jgi:hypothetical protein